MPPFLFLPKLPTQDPPQPLDIDRQNRHCHGVFKAFNPMGTHPVQFQCSRLLMADSTAENYFCKMGADHGGAGPIWNRV